MTRDQTDDIRTAWKRVRDFQVMRRAALDSDPSTSFGRRSLIVAAREYLRLAGSVGDAACYAALGGIEAEIARETCEELVR